jgi:hypothetical protein
MSNSQSLLILTIDGLGARDLGAFGNTWIETPAFDRLASRSLLFEHVLTHATCPRKTLAELCSAFFPETEETGGTEMGTDRGNVWLTDAEPGALDLPSTANFESHWIAPARNRAAAPDWDETHCAEFFAQFSEVLRGLPRPFLLWGHYTGLTRLWDAPFAWRERFIDEGDPDPASWTAPPQAELSSGDPDEQMQYWQAWGAEVSVLDRCVDALLEAIPTDGSVRVVLTSPRGYPLGEHGVVGFVREILYSELTSVPLLVTDFGDPLGWRSQQLVQPSFAARLVTRSTADIRVPESRGPIFCRGGEGIAWRTPEWLLIRRGAARELYAKPDDRWEFNDVSRRCPDEVERLEAESRGVDGAMASEEMP